MLRLRRIADPDPTHLTVVEAGTTFRIELRRRSAARRMTLRVSTARGEIVLTLPSRAPLGTARTFLDAHRGWIASRVAKLPDRVPFEPGADIPLRGVPHRILHWSGLRAATRATRGADGQPTLAVAGDPAAVPGRVRRFLQAEAERDLKAAVLRHAGRLGVTVGRVTIRDTTSRWGSCSSTGALSFSWRLIMAPPAILDYLAAHEVAHLRELNHSNRFWALVQDACPGTGAAERWLARHGSGLHRYG